MSDYLLWIDLETSGLDSSVDEIIEVGAILTTSNLVELGRVHALIKPSSAAVGRIAENAIVLQMHLNSGLAAILASGEGVGNLDQATSALHELIDAHLNVGDGDKLYLAGSGVAHLDRPFLVRWMPTVAAQLHYASIDVGPSRRMWKWATGEELTEDENAKTHRAMDDVEGHLNEAQAVYDAFLDTVMFRAIGQQ